MNVTYLSCAETAKLIRAALKRAFPGCKFSVKSHVYSGGASINIRWVDGPTDCMVSKITSQYRGGSFDGSIDMAIHHNSWLLPDGSACVASCNGTEGSGGSISPVREWMPVPEARLVSFGANYVFTRRDMSPAFAERVLAKARAKWGKLTAQVRVSDYDGTAYFETQGNTEHRIMHETASRLMIVRAGA